MVWDGSTLGQSEVWEIHLDEGELGEIHTAVEASKSVDKPLGHLTQQDFNFGSFTERLLAIRDQVLHGRGFAVIRGLPGNQWSDEELIRAYWGMGTWFGDAVSQNASAHLLGHVIDQRSGRSDDTRIYQTNRAQPFHSDSCDIVGLLCLRKAKSGGASAIASSAAIHNRLLDIEPRLLETLYGTFQCDRYGEIPAGKLTYYSVHIFNEVEGNIVCCGMDPDIHSAQRLDGITPLTAEQIRALAAFQQAAKSLALNMTLQRGDIQLVNNHTIVHAREQFEDHVEMDRRRYMVRLWLSSPLGRTLPEFMAERWGNIEVGSIRGGIKVPGATPVFHLDPNA
ncbi:MAG: TauD/TfdA family dioxygenase [Gammaproteobacteria bacterium]|nr:TauD/TfdA family dioxygenase [Gammaproteobacteria bacterium]